MLTRSHLINRNLFLSRGPKASKTRSVHEVHEHLRGLRTTDSRANNIYEMTSKDLVLLGGGHTHVLLIRALAMKPIPGVRVTLISDKTLTPYSGMLPGFVAGHYSLQQTNIDLNQLCRKARVRWIKSRATAIDTKNKSVHLSDQAAVSFDKLSIDIGSTPDLDIKGAQEFAVGVKPIAGFQQKWKDLLEQANSQEDNLQTQATIRNWGVIGAGAGGVELILAMAHKLHHMRDIRFHLIYQGKRILGGYPKRLVKIAERKLKYYGVSLHPNFSVSQVNNNSVISKSGQSLELDQSIWCTGAKGASWLGDSGLICTGKGFIVVNRYLQSVSHQDIFAAGDIAEMQDDPRPKAGVYAVRQAPFLEQNLRLAFANKPLRKTNLQRQFLSIISLGGKSAVANRNGLVVSGDWVWRWKDYIDQKFMRQFSELPMEAGMASTDQIRSPNQEIMQCGGCGSKLGPSLLSGNLDAINANSSATVEDAFLWQATKGMVNVQSIDGFRSFISNEYLFAKISTNHALSDIQAMGANPNHAQTWINLEFNHPRLQQRDHLRALQAITDTLTEQDCTLSGGHSSQGLETHIAIVANGEVSADKHWRKTGMQIGDVLVLSKPLGTGVILAADMQAAANAEAIDAALESMLTNNQEAKQQLQQFKPNAVTDITGFGLIGHLLEMLENTDTTKLEHPSIMAELSLSAIPVINGTLELIKSGWHSSIYPQLEGYLDYCYFDPDIESTSERPHSTTKLPTKLLAKLLLDPQTSGGLLASLTKSDADALMKDNPNFVAIGCIKAPNEDKKNIPIIRLVK